MRKSALVEILARRLGKPFGRLDAILLALQAAGLVSREPSSRRFPADATEGDIVALTLAAICDVGATKDAAEHVGRYGAMRAAFGATFRETVGAILGGARAHVSHVIVGAAGVSTIINGEHCVFGASPGGAAAITSGQAVMAIAAELAGASPNDADAAVAIAELRRAIQ
ncbi:hypothetical protein [Aurantimonas endophytica]|uniref:Uncharacterized protein n=1 Tax=Aurantimonas endophytica TaxID=1522175 RepID=A0A7W6HCQ0_9HYPH|nr:hypothetical protein [Aurantimonas endophytica]MBB4002637.1 hypothetical protein [Aurantimonas endophytica]MCO6403517.1 hypothetical protein [Aurantimonas endophytica]